MCYNLPIFNWPIACGTETDVLRQAERKECALNADITPTNKLTSQQLAEVNEMLKDQPDFNKEDFPWGHEAFESFMVDRWHRPIGVYIVRGDFGIFDVRVWIRPENRDADTSDGVVNTIFAHLQSRDFKRFSLEPKLIGLDESAVHGVMFR